MYYPSRKGKNDSDDASEAREAAAATTGPGVPSSDPESRAAAQGQEGGATTLMSPENSVQTQRFIVKP